MLLSLRSLSISLLAIYLLWGGSLFSQNVYTKLLPDYGHPIEMVRTSDGFFGILAEINNNSNYERQALYKVNEDGELLWKILVTDSVDSSTVQLYDIAPVRDGGFVACGQLRQGFYGKVYSAILIRISKDGEILWRYKYPKYSRSFVLFKALTTTISNEIILLGKDSTHDSSYYELLSFDIEDGHYVSKRAKDFFDMDGHNQLIRSDSEVIVIKSGSPEIDTMQYVFKVDTDIQVVGPIKTYTNVSGVAAILCDDNGIATYDSDLVKLDMNLDSIWQKPYSEFQIKGFDQQAGTCVAQTDDGGYILGGNVSNDFYSTFYLIKTNEFGQKQWVTLTNNGIDHIHNVFPANDGGYFLLVSGRDIRWEPSHPSAMFFVHTDEDGKTTSIENFEAVDKQIIIYPNPVENLLTINGAKKGNKVGLINLIGETVVADCMDVDDEYCVDLHDKPAGTYVVSIYSENKVIIFSQVIIIK